MKALEGHTAGSRRTKVYLVECMVNDIELDFDGEGDVEITHVQRRITFPTLAHGPEHAIQKTHVGNVLSVRRIRSSGLLRAILCPDDEYFDLHRGELEEYAERYLGEEPDEYDFDT